MTEDLIKVSTYAKRNKVSTTWVYKLIEKGILEKVVIDGVIFVKPK